MQGRKPPVSSTAAVVTLPNVANLRIPDPPATLPEGLARECWNDVIRELVVRNIYDTDLRDMVEAYCVMRARFIEANEKVLEQGMIIKSKRGSGRYNPYVTISNHAYDRMVRLAQELGLTAVRRGSASRLPGASGTAPAEKFLRRAT